MSQRIHEERLVALLQCLLPKEAVRSEVSVPRASRRIDLLLHLGAAQDFWGPLGPLLASRTVVLEHEHHPPSRRKVRSALGKLAWVREGRATGIEAVTFGAAAGLNGEAAAGPEAEPEAGPEAEPAARARQPPLLLVVSPGCPRWIAEGREGFVAWEHEGIYRARMPLLGEVVFVHLRGLAPAPGNSVLRLLAPPRSDEEARANIRRLMGDEKMVQSTKRAIKEAIMRGRVAVSPAERRSLVDEVFEQGARRSLLRFAEALGGPEGLSALEHIEDMDELEARVGSLLDELRTPVTQHQSVLDEVFERGQKIGQERGQERGQKIGQERGRQALLRLAETLVGPEDLAALEHVDDLDDLEARLQELLRR